MVAKTYAASQVARLAGLEDFPKGYKEAIAELVIALEGAKSDQHAKEIIDVWMQPPPKKCPTPADIRMAVYAEDHEEYSIPWEEPKGLCGRCQGYGNVQREDGVYERCHCENGKAYPQNLLDMMNGREAHRTQREREKTQRQVSADELNAVVARAIAQRALAGQKTVKA